MERGKTFVFVCAAVVVVTLWSGPFVKVSDGAAADISSCPDALTKLLPCLPYSQGTAQVPTKDCCTNLETIHETKPECLCALIAASVNHTAGLPEMNTTLALNLGPACKVATKPSVCPSLLGLSPNDPLNKIFNGAASGSDSSTPSTTPMTPTSGNSSLKTPAPNSQASSLALTLSSSFLISVATLKLLSAL